MIWATVSSQSYFCWLYRASQSLAAKNIISLVSVLTVWWCPCVECSLLLLEEGVCYDQCILLAKLYWANWGIVHWPSIGTVFFKSVEVIKDKEKVKKKKLQDCRRLRGHHNKLWKILKEMGIPDHLTWWSWETYMRVRKQQLELDMEQQTGSK